jgi:7-cyano-7-deazaguanine reductase
MAKKLLQLGRSVAWPKTPEEAQIDGVPNPQAGTDYLVRFAVPEFTSICPVTGQPDFAHLVIDYVPGQWLLESKSLKLYVASFRNHGAFHEDCTVSIGKRLAAEIKPKFTEGDLGSGPRRRAVSRTGLTLRFRSCMDSYMAVRLERGYAIQCFGAESRYRTGCCQLR